MEVDGKTFNFFDVLDHNMCTTRVFGRTFDADQAEG